MMYLKLSANSLRPLYVSAQPIRCFTSPPSPCTMYHEPPKHETRSFQKTVAFNEPKKQSVSHFVQLAQQRAVAPWFRSACRSTRTKPVWPGISQANATQSAFAVVPFPPRFKRRNTTTFVDSSHPKFEVYFFQILYPQHNVFFANSNHLQTRRQKTLKCQV